MIAECLWLSCGAQGVPNGPKISGFGAVRTSKNEENEGSLARLLYICLIDSRSLLSWHIEGSNDGKFSWLLAEIGLFGGAFVFISFYFLGLLENCQGAATKTIGYAYWRWGSTLITREGYQSAFYGTSKYCITSRSIVGGGAGSTGGEEL